MVATLTFLPFVVNASISTLTSLDFLGLRPAARLALARRIAAAGQVQSAAPWLGLSAFAIVALMLSLLIFIGEAVRDAFDPRKTFLMTDARRADDESAPRGPAAPATSRRCSTCAISRSLSRRAASRRACRSRVLQARKGRTLALVGELGSGKSVTALSMVRLLPYPAASHPSGEILFKGEDVLKMPDARSARDARQGRHDGFPGADDLAQPAAHDRAADRRDPYLHGMRGAATTARAGRRTARLRSASSIRLHGSAPIRISSPAASASA